MTRNALPRFAALALSAWAASSPLPAQPPGPVIRAGTRLVEVEVVVRDSDGPVTGLLRDDFTLLDQGARQKIAVFNAGASGTRPVGAPLPGGTADNRLDRQGRPIAGATALLYDQLNTSFDNQAYARGQIMKYLESAGGEPVAIYLLGKSLTVAQDFTDDPQNLKQAVRNFGGNPALMLIQNTENMDSTDRGMYNDHPELRAQITSQAIATIVQHLSGMPGRKNLVWLSDTPGGVGARSLNAAGIHLYPVLARGVGTSGVVGWQRDTRELGPAGAVTPPPIPSGTEIQREHANAALAAAAGSVAFMDSRDLSVAVRTAVEDAGNSYVLGFYPSQESLDNQFHLLTVKVGRKGAARGRMLEILYRPGYFAASLASSGSAPADGAPARVAPRPTVQQLLRNPLDLSQLQLHAEAAPDPARRGAFRVKVLIDLHDLSLLHENDRRSGAVDVSLYVEGSGKVATRTYKIDIPDDRFAASLEQGIGIAQSVDAAARAESLRVVVQDRATGVAGSVTLPLVRN